LDPPHATVHYQHRSQSLSSLGHGDFKSLQHSLLSIIVGAFSGPLNCFESIPEKRNIFSDGCTTLPDGGPFLSSPLALHSSVREYFIEEERSLESSFVDCEERHLLVH
jgi:hypothetical protein